MATVSVAVFVAVVDVPSVAGGEATLTVWALVLVGFLAADLGAFHIETRRQAITLAPTEVPLAFGILFVAPPALLLARAMATVFAQLRHRAPYYKRLFNLAVVVQETLVAVLLVEVLGADLSEPSIRNGAAFFAAVVTANVLSAWLVGVAMWVFEGGAGTAFRMPHLELHSVVIALVAVLAVLPVVADPGAGWVVIVPIAAVWLMLRTHGQLTQRYRDLVDVHRFTSSLTDTLDLDGLVTGALDEIRDLLRAGHALVVLTDHHDRTSVVRSMDARRESQVLRCGPGELPGALAPEDDEASAQLVERVRALLDAPLSGPCTAALPVSEVLTGVVVVADRVGASSKFSATDVARLESMAQQLANVLRNAALHGRIAHDAAHDGLTGLPNRTRLEDVLDDRIRTGERVGLVLIDISLGDVNDTLGHAAGDALLVAVARRLEAVRTPEATLARVGGSQFALGAPCPADELAEACAAGLAEPVELAGLQLAVSYRSGGVVGPLHGASTAALLRCADVAVTTARAKRRTHCSYSPELDRRSAGRLELLADVRAALGRDGELEMHFQPKVDLASRRVVSAEALIRWTHPTRGPVPPDEFIPAVERSPLITAITDHALGRTTTMLRRARERGFDLSAAVNISPTDLLDDGLPARVQTHLSRTGLDPERLTLEVTETSMMHDAPSARATLDQLHRLGVRLAIDDFGTGYSSLAYLRDLDIDELKIDKSFITHLPSDRDDGASSIARAVIDLGHELGLEVVAEGIENEVALRWLRDAGCDIGQGYGISRPLPEDEFFEWLTSVASAAAFTPT
ncbi:MAG: bifunctional diguanylate cyclase/phosphodiesterase [Actinomycetota bacterium]